MKRLLIRVDATTPIGGGHIMRCLALAQAWQAEGGQAIFLSHCESDALRQRITDEGMEFIPVAYPHPDPRDLHTTLEILRKHFNAATGNQKAKNGNKNWLVLDGYHFDVIYQQAVRAAGHCLLVIDDMAHLPAYHADILLNQNLGAENLKYDCDPATSLLLGPRYALLRQEFLVWRGWRREIPDMALKVLVTMGGGDPDNVTLKVTEALSQVKIDSLEVVVVAGGSNPHFQKLECAVRGLRVPVRLVRNAVNMPELMTWADIAVTGGGSTCWELAFMGLPSVVLTLAENQKAIAENLDTAGVAVNLGWHEQVPTADITEAINRLVRSPEKRSEMTCKVQAMIDGLGANRIVKEIAAQPLVLRWVTKSDCELLWEWVNDSDVRASSFRSEYIPMEEHKRWFYGKIDDARCFHFVGLNSGRAPVGQVRFDVSDNEAEVDVSVARIHRGKGYSSELIRKGIQTLLKETAVRTVHAFVKPGSRASLQAFLKAGFVRRGMETVKGQNAEHLTWKRKE